MPRPESLRGRRRRAAPSREEPPALPVALTLAFIVLPGTARGEALAGFRAFAQAPARSIGLTVLTLVTTVLLWVAALLLGFLITGVASAALAWLAFGTAAVVLTSGWTALARSGAASAASRSSAG